MATDIFKQDSNIAGSWSMDKAIIQFSDDKNNPGGSKLIATGFQMRYSRQITPFRPINIEGTYLVGGRGIGSLTVQALIGPNSAIKKFLDTYGDLCKAQSELGHMDIRPGGFRQCDKKGNETTGSVVTFSLDGCALNDLSLSVQQIGELSVVNTAMSMIFTSLTVKEGAGDNIN